MTAADFWSRRRAAVAAEEAAEDRQQRVEIQAEHEAAAADRTDAEVLEELGLPDPESLGIGDDFKAFLGAGVPARLRTRALRRLWRTNPVLANLDGLVDYGEDYTDAATMAVGVKTAYQVGKGFARDTVKALLDDGAQDADRDQPVAGDAAPPAQAELPPVAEQVADRPVHGDELAEASAPVRRMRFVFDDRAGAA